MILFYDIKYKNKVKIDKSYLKFVKDTSLKMGIIRRKITSFNYFLFCSYFHESCYFLQF